MHPAVESVQADRAALLEICGGLTGAQWRAPSGCPGWSVQDLVTHLANICWVMVDPSRLPEAAGEPAEHAHDLQVQGRRGRTPAEVVADSEEVSQVLLEQLPGLEGVQAEVPLGDMGTYPVAMIPYAYSFDHYTHIRADLFAPRGPLGTEPPPSDEVRLAPTLTWIEAALPQQNRGAAAGPAVEIRVTGTCERTITVGAGQPRATITSDAPSFVRWVTQRASWQDLGIHADGDEDALAAARALHVF
jgi:uncharacterized protein (TIGR03083 family)